MLQKSLVRRTGLFDVSVIFDPFALHSPTLRAATIALRKFAIFTRREIRRSMRRKRKRRSIAGADKPNPRTGRLRGSILWAQNIHEMWVIIGPRKFSDSVSGGRAPGALERGGMSIINSSSQKGVIKPVYAKIGQFPYMGPGYAKMRPKAAGLWANAIKGL